MQPDSMPLSAMRGWEGEPGAPSRKTGLRIGHAHAIWAHGRRTTHGRGATEAACMDVTRIAAIVAALASGAFGPAASADPPVPRCASQVVSYVPGTGAGAAYRNPLAALGPPARFTGVGIEPGPVTPFRPAFMPGEIVSIGRGGSLVIAFEQPVIDDARHPFGIDLIVYGNAFCADAEYPSGVASGTFSEGGTIELSSDGVTWIAVPEAEADGGLPTLGYSDVDPYATEPGLVPTDPARPVDPAMTPASMEGIAWAALVAAYDGAAGGTGIDLGPLGLASARFVRITVAADAAFVPEVDAIVAVRAPAHAADLDGDGAVNGLDLGILLGAWGVCASCAADMNGDGMVDGLDLGAMLGAWS